MATTLRIPVGPLGGGTMVEVDGPSFMRANDFLGRTGHRFVDKGQLREFLDLRGEEALDEFEARIGLKKASEMPSPSVFSQQPSASLQLQAV